MLKITVLGSGTSHGIPMVGCACEVCKSDDPKDSRMRSSILVSTDTDHFLIDTATEFRLQAIRAGITRLDAICFTHSHADHIHGLDDIRPLTREIPARIYASGNVLRDIRKRFDYIFKGKTEGGGVPRVETKKIFPYQPFLIGTTEIMPLKVMHGRLEILGYRIGNAAYITDCSYLPERTIDALTGLDVLILGALRERPHPTHLSFKGAIDIIERINPRQSFFTHLSHNHSHSDILKYVRRHSDKKIEPAYDGLSFTLA